MELPCVAVILPAYNAEKTLSRAIESVLNQTYANVKLYIINDKSNDNTENIIRSYEKYANIFVINHDVNKGVSEARNSGLKASGEKLVSFIDSDDEWHKEKLAKQVEVVSSGYNIVFTSYNYIKNNSINKISFFDKKILKNQFLKKKFRVCFSTVLIFRSVNNIEFKKLGHEDFLFIYEYLDLYKTAYIIPEALCNHFIQDDSLSSHKKKAAVWHYKVLKRLYPYKICFRWYLFVNYVYQALKFKFKNRC